MKTQDFVSKLGLRFCNTGGVDFDIYESALGIYNSFCELCFATGESEIEFSTLVNLLETFCRDESSESSYKDIDYGISLLLMQFFYMTIIYYKDFRIGDLFLSKINRTFYNFEKYEKFLGFWALHIPYILKQM